MPPVYSYVPNLPQSDPDAHRVITRAIQIGMGKSTVAYHAYTTAVPSTSRSSGMPVTPDITCCASKKQWQNATSSWRRDLHAWEPSVGTGNSAGIVPLHMLGLEQVRHPDAAEAAAMEPAAAAWRDLKAQAQAPV